MQSFTSKIFMSMLRLIFHSPLSDSSKLSDNAAKLTKDKKSKYRPSKNFDYSKHTVDGVKYEKIVNSNRQTDKVILMIHGGGFKIELNDFYRSLSEKYSNMFGGATVISADYGRFPEHQLPSQMHDVVKIYLYLLASGIKTPILLSSATARVLHLLSLHHCGSEITVTRCPVTSSAFLYGRMRLQAGRRELQTPILTPFTALQNIKRLKTICICSEEYRNMC